MAAGVGHNVYLSGFDAGPDMDFIPGMAGADGVIRAPPATAA